MGDKTSLCVSPYIVCVVSCSGEIVTQRLNFILRRLGRTLDDSHLILLTEIAKASYSDKNFNYIFAQKEDCAFPLEEH